MCQHVSLPHLTTSQVNTSIFTSQTTAANSKLILCHMIHLHFNFHLSKTEFKIHVHAKFYISQKYVTPSRYMLNHWPKKVQCQCIQHILAKRVVLRYRSFNQIPWRWSSCLWHRPFDPVSWCSWAWSHQKIGSQSRLPSI